MIQIARDKKKHLYVGAGIGFAGGWIAWVVMVVFLQMPALRWPLVLSALGLTLIASLVWESYGHFIEDKPFDWKDVAFSNYGGFAAALLWLGCTFLPNFYTV